MNGELLLGEFAEIFKNAQAPDDGDSSAILATSPNANEARSVVYKVLSRHDRREQGVFFSGDLWAKRMVDLVDVSRWNRFIDPSAGIGDLLLALAQRLPLATSISATLENWSNTLLAVDLRASFLDIAWHRICRLAVSKHKKRGDHVDPLLLKNVGLKSATPANFKVANSLTTEFKLLSSDCILMNPPYQRIQAPKGSLVGAGLRTAAALHLEQVLKNAPDGVGIIALVPDVLRSGSSYRKFREHLSNTLDVRSFEAAGHFGESADIDVAILAAITKSALTKSSKQEKKIDSESLKISITDLAHVRVGPVVPHRTLEVGAMHGYLTAKNTSVNAEISDPPSLARYEARLEQAPFLVLRRTSSPSDKQRARATIVKGSAQWLVENHLIIVKPRDGTLAECRRILSSLNDHRTNDWLNAYIRCRHLTVGAIKGLPYWRPYGR